MIFPTEIKTKKIQKITITFSIIFFLGFSFLVLAENNSNSSQNIFLDNDQDGVSNEEEKIYGTDPNNKDSDGDGYSDGIEIKSGYDPLKPSPGDKLVSTGNKKAIQAITKQENLTKKLAQEILAITEKANLNEENIDTSSVEALINQTFSQDLEGNNEDDFVPIVSEDEIKIKKQNYQNFSKKKQLALKKEDAIKYISGISYIITSNSPTPVTSGTDVSAVINAVTQQVTQAFTLRDISKTKDLKLSGEKILSQIKDVEVPEDMIDIHVSALSFAKYAIEMERYITPVANDPVADIQNLSSINGLISNVVNLITQIENKLSEYDLTEEDISKELQNMGFENF